MSSPVWRRRRAARHERRRVANAWRQGELMRAWSLRYLPEVPEWQRQAVVRAYVAHRLADLRQLERRR